MCYDVLVQLSVTMCYNVLVLLSMLLCMLRTRHGMLLLFVHWVSNRSQ